MSADGFSLVLYIAIMVIAITLVVCEIRLKWLINKVSALTESSDRLQDEVNSLRALVQKSLEGTCAK